MKNNIIFDLKHVKYCVYSISINDVIIYIGKTNNFLSRISTHLHNSKYYFNSTNKALHKLLFENIIIENFPVIEIIEVLNSNKEALEMEYYHFSKNISTIIVKNYDIKDKRRLDSEINKFSDCQKIILTNLRKKYTLNGIKITA